MSDKYPPGTQVTIKVDGREYLTYIDPHGVQRFYANGVINALYKQHMEEYERLNAQYGWGRSRPKPAPGVVDLNELARAYGTGLAAGKPPWTRRDYIEFNMMLGYSVSGLCDLSIMDGVTIENPCWGETVTIEAISLEAIAKGASWPEPDEDDDFEATMTKDEES